ncbi:hypothetical protein NQ317_007029 [Molorchus minor]|uniref:Uncharacterized protein n=1 Tax=Molorchus minor TaxID=1323400 RepID=A0ABQ9J0C7_9CUCU|nr:hypothetical protein NQ317_007029 [Molorchus minor]
MQKLYHPTTGIVKTRVWKKTYLCALYIPYEYFRSNSSAFTGLHNIHCIKFLLTPLERLGSTH